MNQLTRKEQIQQRTELCENRDLLIRYREKLKYKGIVTTKQGTLYHKWLNDDFITNIFYVNQAGEVYRLFRGKVVPQVKYQEILNQII